MVKDAQVLYESRVKPCLVKIVVSCFRVGLHSFYSVSHNDNHFLEDLKNEGFVLLPKHHSWSDILLTGVFLQNIMGRYGHYVMKQSLPGWMEYLGGLPIYRERELKRKMGKFRQSGDDSEARRMAVSYARENNDALENNIVDLLIQDHIVVLYPEATRSDVSEFEVKLPVIKNILQMQEKYYSRTGKFIPFVPLSIEYAHRGHFRSEVLFNAAEPMFAEGQTPKQFGEELKQRIDGARRLV